MGWYLWVVEMLCGDKWHPTVGVRLTREDGRDELTCWRRRNADDKFRLVKYERAGG